MPHDHDRQHEHERGTAIELSAVSKHYSSAAGAVPALREVTLRIPRGRLTAVMGPSGSGKSTLLQCAAGLDRPSAGTILFGGLDLAAADERTLSRVHRERIGFIFQSFNLLPMLSAYDNVALPLRLAGRRVQRSLILAALGQVGLADLGRRRPAELSGGQQQRVAIARALAVRPEVIFADEPTGALDTATSHQVLGLLRTAVDRSGRTVVMVTHDPQAAAWADDVVFLVDGRLRDTMPRPTAAQIATALRGWER